MDQKLPPHRTIRRFTPEEVALLTKMYLEYAPTIEIARVLGRDEGTVRQKVLHLGLRRSKYVSRALGWAPPHIRERVSTLSANEFLEECHAWREKQHESCRLLSKEEGERRFTEIAATCAEIDASLALSRNEKMIAKRIAGATLQFVGNQHGITRERVRQLTVGRPRKTSIQEELERLDRRRETLLRQHEESIQRQLFALKSLWESLTPEVQDEFLNQVGAVRNDQTVGATSSPPAAVEP